MKKSKLRNIIRESIKGLMTEQGPCDISPTSACAQQWFAHKASNYTSWMNRNICQFKNKHYFNLLISLGVALDQSEGGTISQNPQWESEALVFMTGLNSWSDIKSKANTYNLPQPYKGRAKRKASKLSYIDCMVPLCSC